MKKSQNLANSRPVLETILLSSYKALIPCILLLCILTANAKLHINSSTTPNTSGVVSYSALSAADKVFAINNGIIVEKGGHLILDVPFTPNAGWGR